MSKQEKIKKIEELSRKLSILREQKEKLGVEVRELAEKRNKLNMEFRGLQAEILKLKNARDEINARVKELKQQRSQIKTEIAEKITEFKNLKNEIEILVKKKPPKSFNELQKEIKSIEWRIQTTPLDLQKEKQLVEKVKQLESQLNIHRKIEQLNQKKLELKTELKALEARAKLLHEKIVREAEKSQKIHEERLKKLEKARKLKTEADNLHQLFLQAKEKMKPFQEEMEKILEETRNLRRKILAEEETEKKKSEESLLKEIEKRAKEKLRRGEKLTWEEFKAIAEKGIAQN